MSAGVRTRRTTSHPKNGPARVERSLGNPQDTRRISDDEDKDEGDDSDFDSDDSFERPIIIDLTHAGHDRSSSPAPRPADFRSHPKPSTSYLYDSDYEEEELVCHSEQKPVCRDGFAHLSSGTRAPAFQPGHHEFEERFLQSFRNDDPTKVIIQGNR